MTKPANSNRPGTLPCVGEISGASTLAASAVPVGREAAPPALPVLQGGVDLAHLAVLLDRARRPLLAELPARASLLVPAQLPVLPDLPAALLGGAELPLLGEPPVEEVSVPLKCRSLSAAMPGR